MNNYSKGIIGTVIAVLLISGFYLIQGNVKSKVKNSGEKYLTEQLDRWKEGKLNNRVCNLMPDEFKGNLSEWKNYKLTGYFIEDVKAESKYVRRRRFGRRRGIMYYLEKLSSSNVYIYADVELDMEDPDGYPKTFNIRYRLEPRGNGEFFITKGTKLKLF